MVHTTLCLQPLLAISNHSWPGSLKLRCIDVEAWERHHWVSVYEAYIKILYIFEDDPLKYHYVRKLFLVSVGQGLTAKNVSNIQVKIKNRHFKCIMLGGNYNFSIKIKFVNKNSPNFCWQFLFKTGCLNGDCTKPWECNCDKAREKKKL